ILLLLTAIPTTDLYTLSLHDALPILTQVIPETAQAIAEALGEKDFRISDLLRPKVSLRFGAHYLGEQVQMLGGNIPAALAAYNRSEEHTSELQSRFDLVCRLLLDKKK